MESTTPFALLYISGVTYMVLSTSHGLNMKTGRKLSRNEYRAREAEKYFLCMYLWIYECGNVMG